MARAAPCPFPVAVNNRETNPVTLRATLHESGAWRPIPDAFAQIPIPRNLFVVGTVNVDETTYMFSPKVLDRANTFEFRVTAQDLSTDIRKPVPCIPGDPRLVQGFLALAMDHHWHLEQPASGRDDFVAHLRRLHELLAEAGFEFGHRVFYEAIRFAALLEAAGNSSVEQALDRQVMQKILPRLHGNRRRLEPVLCALGQFCQALTHEPGTRFDPERPPTEPPRLSRSFDKIRRMTRSLRANQFISFAE